MKIPIYKTEGIIIRKFNSGEFDKLLVVYTKDFGKILVKAKSLRKKTAKLSEFLELFNYVHLALAKGKNIDTIAGATLISCFPNLRKRLSAIGVLYYLCELVDKLAIAPEKDARIWNMLTKTFYFLEEEQRNKATIKKLINRFEHNLISYLGYNPEKKRKSYLEKIQHLCGEQIVSFQFLNYVL